MSKPVIKINVVSDVVCPWCYIGKRRLEKAIELSADQYDFEIEYHPFELNADMPAKGVNQKEYLSNKFGGDERYEQITEHTKTIAAQEGLIFDFEKQNVSPNTRNLHAIIKLAKEEGIQLQIVEAFFKAYFTEGIDLSNNENILGIASACGLDKEKAMAYLADDNIKLEISLAEMESQKLGIRGVPYYIINNKFGISGAQMPNTFLKAFEEIGAESLSLSGEACDVDNKNC
jgi:predicted DsbA family dithiol-disulfide isomerase